MTPPLPPALQRLAAIVAVATGLATARRPIDLGGLELEAGLLCAQALDLPPEQGAALRPALVAMVERIDGLKGLIAPTRPT